MREIQIDELRELQMQILDYVDAFCRKHDIKYTISGGTLLGAVRHGGYIPWDDDMDIQMLRSEYNRFTELWNREKSCHDHFELVNIESGNNMGYPFGKVHDTRTVTYIGKIERTGVFIDVFPLDNVLDEADFLHRHGRITQLYKERGRIFGRMQRKSEGKLAWKQIVNDLLHPIPHITYNEMAEKINTIAMAHSAEKSSLVFELTAGQKCKKTIPISVFEDYTNIKFENRVYMSVSDFDTYLTQTFGDYMTPPPVTERKNHMFQPYWR